MQGSISVPDAMERTYIEAEDSRSLFYRALDKGLRAEGVDVVDSPDKATAVFTIYYDFTSQRVLSVSTRNVPTEYEVFYTISYGLMSGEETLIDVQDMTAVRDYTYDETLVLGKAHEEEVLRAALVQDLVRIVLKQISVR
jgi:outer membrane lipopolysaccharide assembly protein LptE/RlpB